jgi:acetyl-CoA carboxylase biotin carboxyl carrier protein
VVFKLINSVTAGVDGLVTAVHATDGELVEFGQPLFTLGAVDA